MKWEAIVGDYKPVKVEKWRLIGVSLLPSGYCNTKTVTVVAFYWSAILMTTKPFHLLSFSQLSVSLVLNQKSSEFSFKLFVFISCLLYFCYFGEIIEYSFKKCIFILHIWVICFMTKICVHKCNVLCLIVYS